MNTTIIILVLFIIIPVLAIFLFIEYKRRNYLNLLDTIVEELGKDNLKEDEYKLLLSISDNYKRKKYIWILNLYLTTIKERKYMWIPNQHYLLIDILQRHNRNDLVEIVIKKRLL